VNSDFSSEFVGGVCIMKKHITNDGVYDGVMLYPFCLPNDNALSFPNGCINSSISNENDCNCDGCYWYSAAFNESTCSAPM